MSSTTVLFHIAPAVRATNLDLCSKLHQSPRFVTGMCLCEVTLPYDTLQILPLLLIESQ